jgi:hypothetical protein
MSNNENNKDTGLRGKFNGELYIDKKVFFSRTDVQRVIRHVIDSPVLRKQLKEHKNSR